jgi:D-alanyl-D-alanine carboxypeptidase
VTDSYRDFAHQVSTKAEKGYLAAKPGTSNHGWGLAADVQVGGYGSADYQWLLHNGPQFGWSNPAWAQAGGSGPRESWHWEFNPTGAAA